MLRELFANQSDGLGTLAAAARRGVLSQDSCVRNGIRQTRSYEKGFKPTFANYRHFALTKRGLVVGFPIYQVAPGICNRTDTTVPYSALRRYLSPLGARLILAVEQSR
ncbi:MAG: RsiV family protein [Gaiellaceae bacterium]